MIALFCKVIFWGEGLEFCGNLKNLDKEMIECALANKEFCFWLGKKAENVVFCSDGTAKFFVFNFSIYPECNWAICIRVEFRKTVLQPKGESSIGPTNIGEDVYFYILHVSNNKHLFTCVKKEIKHINHISDSFT